MMADKCDLTSYSASSFVSAVLVFLKWLHHPVWWTPVSELTQSRRPVWFIQVCPVCPWLLYPVFANSPPPPRLRCSGKFRPLSPVFARCWYPVFLSHWYPVSWVSCSALIKCQVSARVQAPDTSRRKCNEPVPLYLHPSRSFLLNVSQTGLLSSHWPLKFETRKEQLLVCTCDNCDSFPLMIYAIMSCIDWILIIILLDYMTESYVFHLENVSTI